MHVMPDQGMLDQQQGQLPAYGSKYQLDAFNQAPPIMHQCQQQQQQQQQMTFPIQQENNKLIWLLQTTCWCHRPSYLCGNQPLGWLPHGISNGKYLCCQQHQQHAASSNASFTLWKVNGCIRNNCLCSKSFWLVQWYCTCTMSCFSGSTSTSRSNPQKGANN